MQLEVYMDVLFLVNVIMDFLILLIVDRVRKQGGSKKRMLLGAAIGGMIACVLAVVRLPMVLSFFITYFMATFLVVRIAFGKQKKGTLALNSIYLLFITFLLGGAISSIYTYTKAGYYVRMILNDTSAIKPLTLFVLGVAVILSGVLLYRKTRREKRDESNIYPIMMKVNEEAVNCEAFLDTGNGLRDPVFGTPVILVEKKLLSDIYERMKEKRPELIRVIPYRSVGKAEGLLMGLKLDELIIVNGEERISNRSVIAALSDVSLDGKRKYQALLHTELFHG